MNKYFLVIWICLLGLNNVSGQSGSAQEQAMQLFTEGNYAEALVKFKKLLTLFPNDPKYLYYTGVCMVETNTDMGTAIQYLSKSSNSLVPRDVYFYLGKAYHYSWQFANALSQYEKFKDFGDKKQKANLQTDMWIAMAKNGMNIAKQASIVVYKKDTIEAGKVYEFYNRYLNNGSFHESPEHWLNFWVSSKERPFSYVPLLSPVGSSIFTSGNNSFRRNKDIYTVRKTSESQWSKPERLSDIINTPCDEDFVYFNETEAALYFASKGHNSIGGYDIFKTVYNPDYKTWSAPINLGYPINSPFDDYLFVPDDSQTSVRFVSNRETSGNHAIVYEIEFKKEYSYSPLAANFIFKNVLSVEVPKTTGKNKVEPKKNVPVSTPAISKKSKDETATNTSPASAKNNYPQALANQKDYNKTLNEAMRYQLSSDSISRIIEDKRDVLNGGNASEATKSKLRTEIWNLDRKAKSTQVKADSLYTIARQYENENKPARKKESRDLTDEMAREALKNDKALANAESASPKKSNSKGKKAAVYDFKVMSNSPYKSTNDIPLDKPLPDGVIYRIQMGAFSKPIEPDRFKGIVPISGETLKNGEIKKYYAGLFSRMSDAEKALNKIREYGFKDAYIVSYFDGRYIPTNRAKELEKEN
ncbi:MAG TPA: SPOR domain-containing protein [Bacteroidales bacterium]|nr:SPOR domain-containing protein [Bacteroidales bacterium]